MVRRSAMRRRWLSSEHFLAYNECYGPGGGLDWKTTGGFPTTLSEWWGTSK